MTNDNMKIKSRQVLEIEPMLLFEIPKDDVVYITKEGEKYTNVTHLERPMRPGKGRGEAETEEKRVENIRRAIKKLRGVIRANFGQDLAKEAHLTITYRGEMTDTGKLYADLKEFIRLLRKKYANHDFEYVAVMEPHGSGGWHIHMLLKSSQPLWYENSGDLSYEVTRELWRKANGSGEGAVHHAKLPSDVRDLGSYFSMYFSTEIPEDVEMSGSREAIKEASKKAVKGSRLKFYPSDFKFYRCSRGIVKPETEKGVITDVHQPLLKSKRFALMSDKEKVTQRIQTMEFGVQKSLEWL